MGARVFPSADDVARAIVAAARLFDEDPFAVARGAKSRARLVALAALRELFPDAPWASLARCCGHGAPRGAQAHLYGARKAAWWRDILLDEVVGTLVADRYGARAK